MNQRKQQRKEKKGSSQADCEPASAEAGSTKVIGRILNLESEMNQRKWQSKERIRKNQRKDQKNQRKDLVKLTVNQHLQRPDPLK